MGGRGKQLGVNGQSLSQIACGCQRLGRIPGGLGVT